MIGSLIHGRTGLAHVSVSREPPMRLVDCALVSFRRVDHKSLLRKVGQMSALVLFSPCKL